MQPNVPAGEKLGYTRLLESHDSWPPSRVRRRHGDVPAATPFLVVAADANDLGNRPIPGARALHNASVEIVDAGGNVVPQPVAGGSYKFRARVRNIGAAPCYSGIAEFAVAEPPVVDAAARGTGTVPTFAVEGFMVAPSATATITCSRVWQPADDTQAAASVCVSVSDLLLDPVTNRFDARSDRHVGRLDRIPDFSGTWEGPEFVAPPGGPDGVRTRVVITQTGLNIALQVYSQVDARPGFGAVPQLSRTEPIVDGRVSFSISEQVGPAAFPLRILSNTVTLALIDPDTLRMTSRLTGPAVKQVLTASMTRVA